MSGPKGEGLLKGPWRVVLAALVLIAGIVFAASLASSPERAWRNLLLHNFYFLALSIAGAFFIAIQYLARAGWATVIRRVPEAMTGYLPIGALLMLALYFGAETIYPWARADQVAGDPVLAEKAPFLDVPGIFLRMAAYLVLWTLLSWLLVRRSRLQDATGDAVHTARNTWTSAIFVVILAITFSLASIEWVMSLEPHWYSTLFPWYVMSSAFVSGVALMTVLVILLRRGGRLEEVGRHHLHDLGKYVFAFSVFWAYLWYSQYMLIWYTNIPEEVAYFVLRGDGWSRLFYWNLAINLAIPFLFLVRAVYKQSERLLLLVCLVVIAGHWLDFYLMVMPSLMKAGPRIGAAELMTGLGVCGLFLLLFDLALRRAPLLPGKDPYLVESIHHHG